MAHQLGIVDSTTKSILVRISDKIMRLISLTSNPKEEAERKYNITLDNYISILDNNKKIRDVSSLVTDWDNENLTIDKLYLHKNEFEKKHPYLSQNYHSFDQIGLFVYSALSTQSFKISFEAFLYGSGDSSLFLI